MLTECVEVGVCESPPEVLLHLAKVMASSAVRYGLTQIHLCYGVVLVVVGVI